jgi:hypothetical protein
MNDDLKAYVDGELPPDAAERLRARLEADPVLAHEGEEFRRLSAALRALPEPEPIGQAATLAALSARQRPIWRGWAVALAGCTAVLLVVSTMPKRAIHTGVFVPAVFNGEQSLSHGQDQVRDQVKSTYSPPPAAYRQEAQSIDAPPAPLSIDRREQFDARVRELGGTTEPEDDGLRATYPESAHAEILREFDLPAATPWQENGVRVRFRG